MQTELLLKLFLAFALHGGSHCAGSNPMVTTPKNIIKGAILDTILDRKIFAFRGIRYAKAPIGELRFQPPVPVDNWTDVYDATKDGAACPQPGEFLKSEDCLFLNVYTTELPSKTHNPKRPVIFYIHPGGFYCVHAASYFIGPQYLLDRDIVLVTINYRLGSLGFISTGDKLAPGNNGLKDQVLALKWVKENILSFGGDPDLVTIMGYSAGGISVTAHLLSPMSKGLFHRAIAMSDTIFAQWPFGHHQLDLAQKQARLVGCPDDTSENIMNCLRAKPADELGDSLPGFQEFGMDPLLLWRPVIELDFGQERFLTEHPIVSVLNGKFANVPIMAGVTSEEFSHLGSKLLQTPEMVKEINDDFERIAPISFLYERNTAKSKNISVELRKHFLGNGAIDNSTIEGLKHLYADGTVGFGVNRGIKLLANKNTENCYYYHFSYHGRYSHVYLPGTKIAYGPVHHDDLIYLFYASPLFPKFKVTDPEYKMVLKLTTLVANFALTGKPIPTATQELDNVDWIPFTNKNNKYMDIGETLKMQENLYEDRYSVWDKLFPLSDYEN